RAPPINDVTSVGSRRGALSARWPPAACRLRRSSTRCIRPATRSRPSAMPRHPERSIVDAQGQMAIAVSSLPDAAPLSTPERALARWLRLFAVLFALGALGFLLRPDDIVRDLDWVGSLLGLPTLPPSRAPVASDFWLALAVDNMATITASALLPAR